MPRPPRLLALALVVTAVLSGGGAVAWAESERAELDAAIRVLELVPLTGTPPGFNLSALADGKRTSLADVRGRPALLYFWATW